MLRCLNKQSSWLLTPVKKDLNVTLMTIPVANIPRREIRLAISHATAPSNMQLLCSTARVSSWLCSMAAADSSFVWLSGISRPDLVPRMSSLVARVYRPRPAMAREPRLDQNRITEELASLHCLKQDTIKLRNDFNLHFTC